MIAAFAPCISRNRIYTDRSMSCGVLRVWGIAGATVAAAALAILAAPAEAAKSPKPDLVISGKPKVSPKEFFTTLHDDIHFNARTTNGGKANAGPSETALELRTPPQPCGPGDQENSCANTRSLVSQDVPKLKAKDSHPAGASGPVRAFAGPGGYDAFVCADAKHKVKESDEQNNCSGAGKVYVIPPLWRGTLNGSAPIEAGVTETWRSDDAEFAAAATGTRPTPSELGPGIYGYRFHGTLTYVLSGTSTDGCAYGGAGVATEQAGTDGELVFDYSEGQYWGSVQLTGVEFPYFITCGGFTSEITGPLDFAGGFISVDPIDAKEMPFGSTTVIGAATEASPEGQGLPPIRWSWELTAGP